MLQYGAVFWEEDIYADLPLCVYWLLFVLSKYQLALGICIQSHTMNEQVPFGWVP